MGYSLALPSLNTTLRELLDIYCSRQGVSYHSVLESDNLETLAEFAATGAGVAFGGELFVRHRLKSGLLKTLHVPELQENDRSIEIQTRANQQLSPMMIRFICYISEVIAADK